MLDIGQLVINHSWVVTHKLYCATSSNGIKAYRLKNIYNNERILLTYNSILFLN